LCFSAQVTGRLAQSESLERSELYPSHEYLEFRHDTHVRVIDGVLVFVGGILLIIPRVLTDLFALVLLIPYTRTIFKRWLRRRFDRMIAAGNVRLQYYGRN
jgi:UPF0716 family protein affecting phage T7 exclusion